MNPLWTLFKMWTSTEISCSVCIEQWLLRRTLWIRTQLLTPHPHPPAKGEESLIIGSWQFLQGKKCEKWLMLIKAGGRDEGKERHREWKRAKETVYNHCWRNLWQMHKKNMFNKMDNYEKCFHVFRKILSFSRRWISCLSDTHYSCA